ncbi:MAG TPA: hypothetical protein VK841_19885 [Polyangiaceae bacterium]|jgi:hypothetical protein|nr:hypothetical protein [Polyangiaceae bacterium]
MRVRDCSSHAAKMLAGAVSALGLFAAGGALAQPNDAPRTAAACIAPYERAQELRQAQHLMKARQNLLVCTAPACPEMVQTDCTKWLGEVIEAIPSVVFAATVGNENTFDVSVTMDGGPLVARLDGKPIEVDPGLHEFVFQRDGSAALSRKVIVPAHEKDQIISVAWPAPAPEPLALDSRPPSPKAPSTSRPLPPLFFALSGASVIGFGAFAGLGLWAESTKNDLQASCSPRCSQSAVNDLQARLLVADVSLGVGAAAAAGALVVFLTRPEHTTAQRVGGASITVMPTPQGAALHVSGAF